MHKRSISVQNLRIEADSTGLIPNAILENEVCIYHMTISLPSPRERCNQCTCLGIREIKGTVGTSSLIDVIVASLTSDKR